MAEAFYIRYKYRYCALIYGQISLDVTLILDTSILHPNVTMVMNNIHTESMLIVLSNTPVTEVV